MDPTAPAARRLIGEAFGVPEEPASVPGCGFFGPACEGSPLETPLGTRHDYGGMQMPFVPYGKRSAPKRARDMKQEGRARTLDLAIGVARVAINGPSLCLPMCVLIERILARMLPPPSFSLRLGSLQLHAVAPGVEGICFDPRTAEGIDGRFHAWLENPRGELLDPSIFVTLAARG